MLLDMLHLFQRCVCERERAACVCVSACVTELSDAEHFLKFCISYGSFGFLAFVSFMLTFRGIWFGSVALVNVSAVCERERARVCV